MAEASRKRKVDDRLPGQPLTVSGDLHSGPPEAPAERATRLRREEADLAHRRFQERVILWAVVVAAVVMSVCLGVIIVPGSPPEIAKWATTLLTAIVSGGLGSLLRPGNK